MLSRDKTGFLSTSELLLFVRNRHRALDVGCGSSGRIIALLQSFGFDVEGVDISSRMIELARRRHPEVTFHQADICEWNLPGKYDFISAWDSVWHVPLGRQDEVLKKLAGGLKESGVLIFTTGGVDSPSEKYDSAMGPRMYHSTLGIPNILKLLAETGCICRHLEYGQHPDLHVYIIAQKA